MPVVRVHESYHRAPKGLTAEDEDRLATAAVARLQAQGYHVACDADFDTDDRLSSYPPSSAEVAHLAKRVQEATTTDETAAALTELTAPHDGVLIAIEEVLTATADFYDGLGEPPDPHIARRLRYLATRSSAPSVPTSPTAVTSSPTGTPRTPAAAPAHKRSQPTNASAPPCAPARPRRARSRPHRPRWPSACAATPIPPEGHHVRPPRHFRSPRLVRRRPRRRTHGHLDQLPHPGGRQGRSRRTRRPDLGPGPGRPPPSPITRSRKRPS
ncbi:hypothetical protein SMICM304S_04225 [Streptomyces microflavus]